MSIPRLLEMNSQILKVQIHIVLRWPKLANKTSFSFGVGSKLFIVMKDLFIPLSVEYNIVQMPISVCVVDEPKKCFYLIWRINATEFVDLRSWALFSNSCY